MSYCKITFIFKFNLILLLSKFPEESHLLQSLAQIEIENRKDASMVRLEIDILRENQKVPKGLPILILIV